MGGGGRADVAFLSFFPEGRVAGHVKNQSTDPSPTALLPLTGASADRRRRNNCGLEDSGKAYQHHICHPGMCFGFASSIMAPKESICSMFGSQSASSRLEVGFGQFACSPRPWVEFRLSLLTPLGQPCPLLRTSEAFLHPSKTARWPKQTPFKRCMRCSYLSKD